MSFKLYNAITKSATPIKVLHFKAKKAEMQNRVLQIHEKMHKMQNFPVEITVTDAKSSAYQVLNTQNAELSLAPCAISSEKFCKSVKNNIKSRT